MSEFTPLNLALIAGFGLFVSTTLSAVITNWWKNKKYEELKKEIYKAVDGRLSEVVSQTSCDLNRATCPTSRDYPPGHKELLSMVIEMRKEIKRQNKLIRLLVAHAEIPFDDQLKAEGTEE